MKRAARNSLIVIQLAGSMVFSNASLAIGPRSHGQTNVAPILSAAELAYKKTAESMTLEQIYSYQQSNLTIDDPIGDYVLCFKTSRMPEKIIAKLKGTPYGTTAPDANVDFADRTYKPIPLDPSKPVIQGRTNPFNEEKFVDMYLQVMREESAQGLHVDPGLEHRWSPTFLKVFSSRFGIYTKFSKLLIALSSGNTARFLRTGHEKEFLSWVLEQPVRSVTPESAFRASLRINQGNVYLTLLTIENAYATHWLAPNRESLSITSRLKFILNYYGDQGGDLFGPWYHLHGMILFGYLRGGFESWTVARTERWGSWILSDWAPTPQKDYANKAGARIGTLLRKKMLGDQWRTMESQPDLTLESSYLSRSEDYRDRLPLTADETFVVTVLGGSMNRPHQNFPSNSVLLVTSKQKDLKGCTVEVMPGLNHFWPDARRSRTMGPRDFRVNRTQSFELDSPSVTSARIFLKGCRNNAGDLVPDLMIQSISKMTARDF